MIPSELEGVDADDVAVELVGHGTLAGFDSDDLVDITEVDPRRQMATLVQGPRRAVVRPVGQPSRQVVGGLPGRDRRLLALTAVADRAAGVRIWRFGRAVPLAQSDLSIVLHQGVLETVADRLEHAVEPDEAIQWITDSFVLPSLHPDCNTLVALLSPSVDHGGLQTSFTVLGRDAVLDVSYTEGSLVALRLAPRRQNAGLLGTALVTARVQLTTELGGQDTAQLAAALLSESDYMARWARYNDREFELEELRADQMGQARYTRTETVGSAYRFHLARGSSSFLRHVSVGGDLMATGQAPTEWRSDISVVGTVQGLSSDWIDLRPLHDDTSPPEQGVLGYALAGSTASYRRRLEAAQRLATGAVPLPELAPLLELRSVEPRRVERRLSWDSPAVRDVFAGTEPTPAQKRAIEVALNTPDVAVIQGPPGTGKTKVIAAIAARIAEEIGDVAASRQILLTSHQHDAVDNVAARTMVFGLPSVKESLRSEPGSWLQQWRQARLRRARELLEGVEHGEITGLRRWAADRQSGYILVPVEAESAADLLAEVDERCGHYLPANVRAELEDVAARLRREAKPRDRNRRLVAAIRSLRVTQAAHADDGPANAMRVLTRLQRSDLAADIDLGPVHAAANADVLAPDLAERLLAARNALLDRTVVRDVRTHTATVRDDVARALGSVVSALTDRLQADGMGMADVLQRFVHDLESDRLGVERALSHYAPVVAATCQAAGGLSSRLNADHGSGGVDTVIVDEAARANPLDMQIPMTLATRRVVMVGDQRQLPHMVDDAIARSISVDEAEAAELAESLFGRLFGFLADERKRGRPERCVTLNQQYRMHPSLGDLVSQEFYEPYGERIESPLPPEQFEHTLPGYDGRCAAWVDIPATDGTEERADKSRRRSAEARWIAAEVVRLMQAEPHLTFGVISFYRAQRDEVLTELIDHDVTEMSDDTGDVEVRRAWRYTTDASGEGVERLRVGTVDAFQGKEFDVVFLSVVRTPRGGESTPNAAFGHLVVENRLCVSMSRQRRLLVAVGDRRGLLNHRLAADHLRPLQAFAELADRERG